jgi:tetratricopeptide (TPR) repeat protein
VAAGSGSLSTRRAGFAALGALILAGASAALAPFVVREVHIVNGLSRRVEVRLDGEHRVLDPGQIIQQQVYGLGGPYEVEARWPGANKPFEVLTVGSEQRTLYNILGAAFLKWEEPVAPSGPDWLPARVYSLPPETQVVSRGGWEAQLRAYVEAGLWQRAAALAKAVFLADPSQIQAGREAARLLVQSDPQQALWFVRGLPQAFPDDPAVAQLALDVLTVLDERSVASRLYEAQAQSAPHSVKRALMAAMAAPPEQVRDAYARVLERFSDSPQAMRAVARIRLADGYPRQALELLEDALELGPESLEDLELRVRALVAEGDVLKASMAVKQFHGDPRHASWELAVLAGRLAWIAGPGRTQYVARDLLPSKLSNSPEHLAAFALLTGESSVSDKELNAVGDPMAREALALTRALLKNFEAAVEQAALARPPVLSRLDPETAAELALELSRLGQKEAAQRVFGSSLALLAARAPLQAYVNTGTVKPEFALLPPGLQAAAYLIRARASEDSRRVEQKYALWADALGGMARQVFGVKEAEPKMWQDPKYQFREHPPHHHAPIRWHTIQGTTTQPPLDSGQPPPERTGERLPRPWPASER